MKKLSTLFILGIISLVLFNSCEKKEDKDINIPGKKDTIVVLKAGELLINKEGKLSELLKSNTQIDTIKILTIKTKVVRQKDLDFIKESMPKLETLNLTDATLSISDSQYGFKDNKTLKHVILPKNLEAVGFGHLGYTNLETVTFTGNKLTRIGEGAFSYSDKIKELELPNSLEIIEKLGFSIMRGLEKIIIPENVILIPEQAFFYDIKLKSVTIKGNVKKLGDSAFAYCKELTKIQFMSATPPTFNEGTWPFVGSDLLYNKDNTPRLFFYVPKGSKEAYKKAWKFTAEGDDAFFKEF